MTLTEFLMARIAEDEAAALRISPGRKVGIRWRADSLEFSGLHDRETLQHIARHDPARVLAECEAKRRIVGLHGKARGHQCTEPDAEGWYGGEGYECHTLRILAAVYADHPDYREEWRL